MWTENQPGPAARQQRSASGALMALAEARTWLTDGVMPVAPIGLDLGDALGATLAGAVTAPADVPMRTIALRDGWAVAADSVAGASPQSPVLLLRKPVWVDAGDPLPTGTDTVLGPEAVPDSEAPPGRIGVVEEAPETEGTRAAGADLRKGTGLAAAGMRLAPSHILGLAACGIGRVDVRRPLVRLVATGPAGVAVGAALAARVAADGGRAVIVVVPGEAGAIAEAILGGPADAVFVVGGTGFGRGDRAAAGLALAGTVIAHGLALCPGETAGFGTASGRPVLLAPGRPDAALAAYLALGRPLLAALAGAESPERPTAPLLRKVVSTLGMSDLVFVRRSPDGIEPLGGAEIPLHRLALADAAVLVPPEREGYGEGTSVEIIPL